MKKFTQILAALALVLSFVAVPASVNAQVDPIPVGGDGLVGGSEGGLPSTGASTPSTPDTGIAPSSRVAQTLLVFIASSAIGAGIAFGVLQLKKKQQ